MSQRHYQKAEKLADRMIQILKKDRLTSAQLSARLGVNNERIRRIARQFKIEIEWSQGRGRDF